MALADGFPPFEPHQMGFGAGPLRPPDARSPMATPDQPTFRVATSEPPTGETLLVALPQLGMANLTAVDYLVQHHEAPEIGYVDSEDLPAMTPVQDGRPRRHTRLFDLPGTDFTVLLGELFIPVWAARSFVDAVTEWLDGTDIEEVLLLHGVPFPHAETEHDVFTVASEDYRERRLAGIERDAEEPVAPHAAGEEGGESEGGSETAGPEGATLGSEGHEREDHEKAGHPGDGDEAREPGFQRLRGALLDGVPGEFLDRHLDERAPAIGALVTPTHPPGPDIDAALRLLEAVETVYGLDVDLTDLEEAAVRTRQFYTELADRMHALQQGEEAVGSRDYPEDRMYM